MTRFRELGTQLLLAAAQAEPRGRSTAIGRSLIAFAQLLVLAFSPNPAMFVESLQPPDGINCTGIRVVSLWCVSRPAGQDGLLAIRIVSIVVLLVVTSGYRPKLTCVPHWYVAFSTAVAMPMANGGDRVLQIAAMLLVPLCIGDDRAWQWTRPHGPLPATWRGASFAAQLAFRLQICAIYVSAVVAKLSDPWWRHGSSMFVILHHPVSGPPDPVLHVLEPLLRSYWFIAAGGWLVIGTQVAIAILIWGGIRARRSALVLGCALHVAIMFMMNLPSFGLAMVGLLVIGCAPLVRSDERGRVTVDGNRQGRAVRSGSGS